MLDQLGLAGAIREFIYPLSANKGNQTGTHFVLIISDELPKLSAAVEVAAYRIITEAVTNVLRHAQAASCRVVLAAHDYLELVITDDGSGLPPRIRHGVGLNSMRERAEEVGGSIQFMHGVPKGTHISVRLPFS